MAGNVSSSDKETIPARYAIKAQAQVFMENGELLLPTLTHSTVVQCTQVKLFDVCSLCVVAEQFVAPTNKGAGVPRTAPDTPQPLQGSSCDV